MKSLTTLPVPASTTTTFDGVAVPRSSGAVAGAVAGVTVGKPSSVCKYVLNSHSACEYGAGSLAQSGGTASAGLAWPKLIRIGLSVAGSVSTTRLIGAGTRAGVTAGSNSMDSGTGSFGILGTQAPAPTTTGARTSAACAQPVGRIISC